MYENKRVYTYKTYPTNTIILYILLKNKYF
nr:MAG TPA: hypothetical protein [Caudoviricetes sp.]DAK90937.1 MAG TPA: hypothetical protein [Caudoviricetes sp.]